MIVDLKRVELEHSNMPVSEINIDEDSVGPYNRLSSSQVNAYKSCKRMWYYEKELKFKILQIPVLYVGRAVEEAICRTLKESPSLMIRTASQTTLSKIPLDENGRPSRLSIERWPAQRIIPLPEKNRPSNIDELREWSKSRIGIHLKSALEKAKQDWQRQERRSGDWSEVDFDYCFEMCMNGINLHLKEVNRCYETIEESKLAQWRSGQRDYWPAPDGYAYELNQQHPLASNGKITVSEAWEITRPWFVEPESEKFSMNAIHPEYWFQGEYDIVYRWDGKIRIVDIKASKGIGDRSGNYIEQLRMYAMLWWVTHDKKEKVSGLEIWYLGSNVNKKVQIPTISEMDSMEEEIKSLWQEIKSSNNHIEKFPPEPLAVRGFAEGGKPLELLSNEKRCDKCDWNKICSGGIGQDYNLKQNIFVIPGVVNEVITKPLNELKVRFNLKMTIDTISYLDDQRPQMKVKQNDLYAKVEILTHNKQKELTNYPTNLNKGQEIILENAIVTSNYKGELTIKIDPMAKILLSNEDVENHSLLEFQARWNVAGKIAYKYDRRGVGKTGREWHRKGIMIFDDNKSIKISGWANDWGPQYDLAEVGDNILLQNIELDAWANQIRGQIVRNSRIHILQ